MKLQTAKDAHHLTGTIDEAIEAAKQSRGRIKLVALVGCRFPVARTLEYRADRAGHYAARHARFSRILGR